MAILMLLIGCPASNHLAGNNCSLIGSLFDSSNIKELSEGEKPARSHVVSSEQVHL